MAYTFFYVQVAIEASPYDGLRRQLHDLFVNSAPEQSLADKRMFYKRLVTLLGEARGRFRFGDWDLLRKANANEEFDSWCAELEQAGATSTQSAEPQKDLSPGLQHVVVTVLILAVRGGSSDDTLGDRCDLQDPDYFTVDTFARLIDTLPMLTFASIKADAVYLQPGQSDEGWTTGELRSADWDYLKPLTGL